MSETELLGRFKTTMGNMEKMLQWASAPFEDRFDQAYLNLSEDSLRTIANAGQAVVAYCTFSSPFVQEIELHDEVDGSSGMQSIMKVPQIQNYLDFVGGDELVVEFYGTPGGANKADKVTLKGDLKADIFLPSSDSDYESKQLGIVNTYNSDDEWVRPSTIPEDGDADDGEPLQTTFTTRAEEFQKIIDVVSFDSFALANYPVVIDDGEFMLDAADENDRDSVSGTLSAEEVEGPDVSNSYSRGFENLFDSITGKVNVGIEDEAPISVVRQSNDNALTLRYLVLPATEG